jgi:hypothetical protein
MVLMAGSLGVSTLVCLLNNGELGASETTPRGGIGITAPHPNAAVRNRGIDPKLDNRLLIRSAIRPWERCHPNSAQPRSPRRAGELGTGAWGPHRRHLR